MCQNAPKSLIMLDSRQKDYISRISSLVRDYSSFPQVICDLIGCQFALESSFGTSSLAVNFNNHCGMKYPKYRPTTCLVDDFGVFAHYSSVINCIRDYILCLTSHHYDRRIESPLEFCSALSWYCPDKDYFTNILKLYKMFKS